MATNCLQLLQLVIFLPAMYRVSGVQMIVGKAHILSYGNGAKGKRGKMARCGEMLLVFHTGIFVSTTMGGEGERTPIVHLKMFPLRSTLRIYDM